MFFFLLFFDSGNYELHLSDISVGYISFSDFSAHGRGFTICFWLKTAHSGFFIEYAVAASIEQNATLVLGLYFHTHSFDILFGSIRRYQTIFLKEYIIKVYSLTIKRMRKRFTSMKRFSLVFSFKCGVCSFSVSFGVAHFPLSDASAGNYGCCLHHHRLDIRFDEYNFHDSL